MSAGAAAESTSKKTREEYAIELQLALDRIEPQQAFDLVKAAGKDLDIVELGTPFVLQNPIGIVGKFKKILPETVRLLVDYKILDGGRGLAEMAYRAGADMVTVSGRTWPETIEEVIETGNRFHKQVTVDLMGVPVEEYETLIPNIDRLKPDYICIHRRFGTNYGLEENLKAARQNVMYSRIAVAGGISLDLLEATANLACKPDLFIAGKAVVHSEDPVAMIRKFREVLSR